MVVTFSLCCRAADVPTAACAAVAAVAAALVRAAARALAVVVLVRLCVVAALVAGFRDIAAVARGVAALLAVAARAGDAFGPLRPLSKHGRSTCLQAIGCSNPEEL